MTSYSEPTLPAGQTIPETVEAWPVVLFVGLVTALIGLVVLAWTDETVEVLSVLFGVQLILFGLFRLIAAFSDSTGPAAFLGLVGVLGMAVGIAVLRNPFESIAVLATLLGVVWIVGGSVDLIGVLVGDGVGDPWLGGPMAALTIFAGLIIVLWPGPPLAVITWVAGLYLFAMGSVICVGAFKAKQLQAP
jgi:uncharacterized membrane protein HdeD (DUF308 family)